MFFPKVSVIITIYNREKYIEQCVRSLLEQTLDSVELVVVDDASTDASLSIFNNVLEEYPDRQPLVNLISLEKNSGRAVARQTGIDHVKGEYVIHVDSDDWIDRDMLELLYSKAKETDADIVGCNVIHEYRTRQCIFKQSYSGDIEEDIRRLLNGKLFPSLCTSLTRTSIIRDNGITFPQGLDTGEDLLFNLQLYLQAHKVVGIENASYHYRHTKDSGSFQHTEKSIKSVIEVARRIETLMRETGNYEKYERDILFRKFSMKCALVTDFKNRAYNKEWLNLFPETHSYIWKYKQFSWKRRVELWLAANNQFGLALGFKNILTFQNKIRKLFRAKLVSSLLLFIVLLCFGYYILRITVLYYTPAQHKDGYHVFPNNDDIIKVAVIGDSWAYLHEQHQCVISDLIKKKTKHDVQVRDYGICGLTSKSLYYALFDNDSIRNIIRWTPDYCVILIGVNDTDQKNGKSYYKKNMELILDFLVECQIIPVVIEIPNYGIEYSYYSRSIKERMWRRISMFLTGSNINCIDEYNNELQRVLIKYNIGIDVLVVRAEDWNPIGWHDSRGIYTSDLMHLNEKGYAILDSCLANTIINREYHEK